LKQKKTFSSSWNLAGMLTVLSRLLKWSKIKF